MFIGRFFGPLRAVVPLVAGMMYMGQTRFQIANVGSAIIWLPAILAPGYLACRVLKDVANLGEKVFVFVFLFFVGLSLITAAGVWVRARLKRAAARRNREPGAQ